MDLQKLVDNHLEASRANEMKTSEQLMLGELTLKLEAVRNQALPIVFDDGKYVPQWLDSWRGSYRELAIAYGEGSVMTASDFLTLCREANGKTYTGYKGGDFLMGKNTPIWVANYGEVSGYNGEDMAVVDVQEGEDAVALITKKLDY